MRLATVFLFIGVAINLSPLMAAPSHVQIICTGEIQDADQNISRESYRVFWGGLADFNKQPERVDVLRIEENGSLTLFRQSYPYFGESEAPMTGAASLGLWKVTNDNFTLQFDYHDYCWETDKEKGTNWKFKAKVFGVHPRPLELICYADPSFEYPHLLGPEKCP